MSLPKRPFTTSSLTSSLKSTLANQPLLNNLTNIDKLSSQASSLAQKAPFFGAINNQFQHHNHQQQDQLEQQRYPANPANSTLGQTNVATGGNIVVGSSGSFSDERISSNNKGDDMNRDVHKLNAGAGIRAPMANAPDVDMSHLTEEERAMIQSVMAKAEMADMGLPVDTSSPSSTNLPSSTSQALTQQRDQQRLQQQLRQQQQQQQRQLQQHTQQQPQHQQSQATNSGSMTGGLSQPIQQQQSMQPNLSHNDNTQGAIAQHQQLISNPTQDLGVGQSHPIRGTDNTNNNLYMPQQADRPVNINSAQHPQQDPSIIMNQSGQYQANNGAVNLTEFSLPSSTMQPFPIQNSQISINSTIHDSNGGGGDVSYQNNLINSDIQKVTPSMVNLNQPDYYQVLGDQNNNIGNLGPYDTPQQSQLPNQTCVVMPRGQASSAINQFECMNQNVPPQVVQFETVPNTQMINNQSQFGQSFDQQYAEPKENFPVSFNQTHHASPAFQQSSARQPLTCAPHWANNAQVQQPKYVSAHDLDYEHAFSDRDLRQTRGKQAPNHGGKPMSRHESMETGRRSARRSRNRDAPDLQAYDLAQRSSSGGSHKSRQLPQPGYSNYGNTKHQSIDPNVQSSREYVLEDKSGRRSKETRKSPMGKPERVRSTPRKDLDKKVAHESSCLTESDLDDDIRTGSESDDRRRLAVASNVKEDKKKEGDEEEEEKDPLNMETADKKTISVDSSEKSDQAMKLLSELKLTEQANQVMEQQQLLIKQSQELIKLQQAQLEQQAELNKTLSVADRDKREGIQKVDTEKEKSDLCEQEQEAAGVDGDNTGSKIDPEKSGDRDKSSTANSKQQPNIERQDDDKDKARSKISSKSRADNDSDTDCRRTTRDVARDLDSTSDLDSHWRSGGNQENSRSSRAKSPVNPKVRSMSALTRKQNRDSIQSPTDTTDSDIDLMSQTSSRHDRIKTSVRPSKSVTRIRREPKGLPPSPLPVAAAIQLHQMQQKHRNQTSWTNQLNSRTNQLRSRSVTSSPNHMLDRMMSGYMTDTQHARPTSPDTMSEYGGQRRRKRLPEPPTNVVPITPSMVRRMVQANRAAAINSGRSFSINTNSSTQPQSLLSRSPILSNNNYDRRPSLNMDYKSTLDTSRPARHGSSSLLSNLPYTSSTQQISSKQVGNPYALASDPMPVDSSGFKYHHKLGDNIDNDYILSAEQISDVKETPELDKLISNLDEYYRLDDSISQLTSSTRTPYTTASAFKPNFRYESTINQTAHPVKSRSPISDHSAVGIGIDHHMSTQSQSRQPNPSYMSNPSYNYSPVRQGGGESTCMQAAQPAYSSYRYQRQTSLDGRLNTLKSLENHMPTTSPINIDESYPPSTSYSTRQYCPADQRIGNYFDDTLGPVPRTCVPTSNAYDFQVQPVTSQSTMTVSMQNSYGTPRMYSNFEEAPETQPKNRTQPYYSQSSYLDSQDEINYQSDYNRRRTSTRRIPCPDNHETRSSISTDCYTNNLPSMTKDDIINNGPKYNSIGYRFRTENQNKYVTEPRTPIECLQSRYPYPYKRILLSKNPKDRLGNGIGVKILGGQPLPNIYDKVNKCVLTSGAFVTEVFHSSRVYLMDEMHEGDQVIEWNGVNLCNRGDGEVQQILFSQFSDDEVEIIYLSRQKFKEAYGANLMIDPHLAQDYVYDAANGTYDMYAGMNKPNSYYTHGHNVNEPFKRSIRRKLSLSSISHMWSK